MVIRRAKLLNQIGESLISIELSRVICFTHFGAHTFLPNYYGPWGIGDITKICLTYLSCDVFEEGSCVTNAAMETR